MHPAANPTTNSNRAGEIGAGPISAATTTRVPTASATTAAASPLDVRRQHHRPAGGNAGRERAGAAIEVRSVGQVARERSILRDLSFSVAPGEVVAIVGASGSGKTTLLETMAGIRPPARGEVRIFGHLAPDVGYVPQDDIIHLDLPLRRTVRYAAQLRLPAGTEAETIDRTVDETLAALDLTGSAAVRVGSLSGGQRKRASIAVEILTNPDVFFLDEPTSGLDPATAREVLRLLRRLAATGKTIVLTTHSPTDIDLSDRIVFLAGGGRLAFVGTPDEARAYFATPDLAGVYERLALEDAPEVWAERFAASRRHLPAAGADATGGSDRPTSGRVANGRVGAVRQWAVLTRRSADILVRNRLTLAILVGSPVLVITMMAVLFRPGAFQNAETPGEPTQTVFWLAFAGFFFGLTYGLLQIVGELPIIRRERRAGLHAAAYVGAKVTVLSPVLVAVAGGMLAVLRMLDRLPAADAGVYGRLVVALTLEALAALALGLLTSVAVTDSAQATLALPMLCFPQVLFAGGIVPIPDMAGAGRAISTAMANRWAFESLGRTLRLDHLLSAFAVPHAQTSAFAGTPVEGWAVLGGFAGLLLLATVGVLRLRAPASAR